jgi:mono/diheme cytochrome c family protein
MRQLPDLEWPGLRARALHVLEREDLKLRLRLAAAALVLIATPFAAPFAESPSADPALANRGKYLATAGNCISCHSKPGGMPFAGGLPFKTPFGTVYSTNITPDARAGIGHWTEDQFRRALREGIRPNGEHLYPVFPYTAFTKIPDGDVSAIFAYLKTVPPARYRPPGNELSFPYSQRGLMTIWNKLYFDATRFAPDATKSPDWNRGAYLIEALGHCGACHSPRNFLGAERTGLAFTGGRYFDKVPSGGIRPWSAVNLSQTKSGLASWSRDDIVAYLKTGVNLYATSFGPMNEVIMNSTRHLSDADLRAMAVYIKSLPAPVEGIAPKPAAAVSSEGAGLYEIHCATCHLPSGKGAPETGPALAGNPVVQTADPASLINVILFGPQLPNPPPPVQRQHMEGYEGKLGDGEIAALAGFIRTAWGNRGGSVSPDQVAAQR